MTTWDDYFFDLLPLIAKKSKDQSSQIAAIIVGPDHEIRSTGYNSFPRGINDHCQARQKRPRKYLYFAHAEENAIVNAALHGTALRGCQLYVNWLPCAACTRMVINAGIKEIVLPLSDNTDPWFMDFENAVAAVEMISESGIKVRMRNSDIGCLSVLQWRLEIIDTYKKLKTARFIVNHVDTKSTYILDYSPQVIQELRFRGLLYVDERVKAIKVNNEGLKKLYYVGDRLNDSDT
jgi:dCMP deaminase